jgi:hypothetical protein
MYLEIEVATITAEITFSITFNQKKVFGQTKEFDLNKKTNEKRSFSEKKKKCLTPSLLFYSFFLIPTGEG